MFMGCLWVLSLITASCFRNPPWRPISLDYAINAIFLSSFYKIFLVSWSDRHRKPVGSPRTAPNWLRLWHAHKFPKLPSLLEEVSAPAITACVEGLMTRDFFGCGRMHKYPSWEGTSSQRPCPNHSWIQTKERPRSKKIKGGKCFIFLLF